jgi:hypothetical protein
MSIQLSKWRLRIAAAVDSVGSPALERVTNKITGQALSIPRANELGFEVGFFWNGDPLDLSIYSALSLNVWLRRGSSTLLMSRTLAAGQFANTLDADAWTSDTAQHARFEFATQETNIDLDGEDSATFFLEIRAVVTATGGLVTLLETPFTIEESEAENPSVPPATPPDVPMSLAAALASFVPRHGDAARWAFGSDGAVYEYCDGTTKWHRRTLQLDDGVVKPVYDQTGVDTVP